MVHSYLTSLPFCSLCMLYCRRIRWKWTEQCDQSFKAAKDSLTSPPVLVHYNPKLPLRLSADASSHGLGAVLSHVMPDKSERPIAFASRTPSSSEKKSAQRRMQNSFLSVSEKNTNLALQDLPTDKVHHDRGSHTVVSQWCQGDTYSTKIRVFDSKGVSVCEKCRTRLCCL